MDTLSQQTKLGRALSRLLADYGIDTVFGIPGVHNVELFRGFEETGMRLFLPRHEQGAGFMADGYARACGRPAACFVITGPGLTNIMTPIGQAYSDSVPMLVFASTLDVRDIAQAGGRLHEMIDQKSAAASVSGFAAIAYAAEECEELVARAFTGFATGRPRPAYIELPIDVLASEVPANWTARRLPGRPVPNPDDVAEVATALTNAERPMLLLGGGAVDAAEPLRRLAETLRAAVATTAAGKGIVEDGAPLSLGATLTSSETKAFMETTDVIVAIGTELSETDFWGSYAVPPGKTLFRVDIDPRSLADGNLASLGICADADAFAKALLAALPAKGGASRLQDDEISALRARVVNNRGALRRRHAAVLEAMKSALPKDAIIASDMTQIAYSGTEVYGMDEPRCWLHPCGFGTLGYALPAAIGAQIAEPERAVVALIGDYGFQYTINELGVAAEHDLPVIILLWNNDALGQIRDDMVQKQITPLGTSLKNPDFADIARAYGCGYAAPQSLEEVTAAVAAARTAGGPTIIEVHEDRF